MLVTREVSDGPVGVDRGGEGGDLATLPWRRVAALDPSGAGPRVPYRVAVRGVHRWESACCPHPVAVAAVAARARGDLSGSGCAGVLPGDRAPARTRPIDRLPRDRGARRAAA